MMRGQGSPSKRSLLRTSNAASAQKAVPLCLTTRDRRALLLNTLFLPSQSRHCPVLPSQLQEMLWERAGGLLSPPAPEGRMLFLGGTAAAWSGDGRDRHGAARPERLSMSSHSTNATGGRWLGLEGHLWCCGTGESSRLLLQRAVSSDSMRGPKSFSAIALPSYLGSLPPKSAGKMSASISW